MICLRKNDFTILGSKGVTLIDGALYWNYAHPTTQNIDVLIEVGRVMRQWGEYLPFPIYNGLGNKAQIQISFAFNGEKHLPFPFDNLTLGYAFQPDINNPIASDIYLNDAIRWNQKFLYDVIKHEVGHALGIGHTDVINDIMYHSYNPANFPKITEDSIDALVQIYGKQNFMYIFANKKELLRLNEATLIRLGALLNLKLDSHNTKSSHVNDLWKLR